MILFNHITKYYRSSYFQFNKFLAVNDISFEVFRNEVFGIIGLNGAGKSTLIKILLGLIRQDSGVISLSGSPSGSPSNLAKVGYLPEHPSLYPNLTLTEHLLFACRIARLENKETKQRIESTLHTVGLEKVGNDPIKRFSKGMTQRAALAYAIILEPEILILDEPMSGLDPLGRQLVIKVIQEHHDNGSTILFCSHILTDVERLCDRIGIMHKGELCTIVRTPLASENSQDIVGPKYNQTPLEILFHKKINT